MSRKRAPTTCQACGCDSWAGRVCRGCRRYYGGSAENAIAGARLADRLKDLTYDQVAEFFASCEFVDFICPDMFGPSLPEIMYGRPARSAAPTRS